MSDDDLVERFLDAAARQRTDHRELVRSRGAPSVYTSGVDTRRSSLLVVQGMLSAYPRGTLLLFYAGGADSSSRDETFEVFAVGSETLSRGSTSAPRGRLSALTDSLRLALGVHEGALRGGGRVQPEPSQSGRRGFGTAGAGDVAAERNRIVGELSRLLFPAAIHADVERATRLLIVPTEGIGALPIGLLRPLGTQELLVERLPYSVAASLFDLVRDVALYRQLGAPLVVGDPQLRQPDLAQLPPLPGAVQEADSVAGLLGTSPLLGAQASKSAVVARAANAAILHLASHGVADPEQPLDLSFLALSASGEDAGRWTAREIQHSAAAPYLVVLSACQSGLGGVHRAGIIGLARAFQLAGAAQVVVSLWSVNDLSTVDLMTEFTTQLLHYGGDVPLALQQAMLKVRGRWPDPSDWASFTVFGATPPDPVMAQVFHGSAAPGARAVIAASHISEPPDSAAERARLSRGGLSTRGNTRVALSPTGIYEVFVDGLPVRPLPRDPAHANERLTAVLSRAHALERFRRRMDSAARLEEAVTDLRIVPAGVNPATAIGHDTLIVGSVYDVYVRVDTDRTEQANILAIVEGFSSAPVILSSRPYRSFDSAPARVWHAVARGVGISEPTGIEIIRVIAADPPGDPGLLAAAAGVASNHGQCFAEDHCEALLARTPFAISEHRAVIAAKPE